MDSRELFPEKSGVNLYELSSVIRGTKHGWRPLYYAFPRLNHVFTYHRFDQFDVWEGPSLEERQYIKGIHSYYGMKTKIEGLYR